MDASYLTIEQIKEKVRISNEAYDKALLSKRYDVGDKRHDNHDIDMLKKQILYWSKILASREGNYDVIRTFDDF